MEGEKASKDSGSGKVLASAAQIIPHIFFDLAQRELTFFASAPITRWV